MKRDPTWSRFTLRCIELECAAHMIERRITHAPSRFFREGLGNLLVHPSQMLRRYLIVHNGLSKTVYALDFKIDHRHSMLHFTGPTSLPSPQRVGTGSSPE